MTSDEDLGKYGALVLTQGHSYQSEKLRVKMALANASLEEMIQFSKDYQDWSTKCFPGLKVEKGRKGLSPGDLIFEVGFPARMLIFIGSVRDKGDGNSTRLCISSDNKELRKAHNIRDWEQRAWKQFDVRLVPEDRPDTWVKFYDRWFAADLNKAIELSLEKHPGTRVVDANEVLPYKADKIIKSY